MTQIEYNEELVKQLGEVVKILGRVTDDHNRLAKIIKFNQLYGSLKDPDNYPNLPL